jgi:hypothetical protein
MPNFRRTANFSNYNIVAAKAQSFQVQFHFPDKKSHRLLPFHFLFDKRFPFYDLHCHFHVSHHLFHKLQETM